MKCKILDVNDSLITYQKTNSNLVLKAKVSQLDYILFEDGTGKNYTGKPINQDDIKEAFEYRPPGMDTLIVKNKETEIDYSQLDYSPLEINIKCEPHQLFQITAKQLLTQGFLINQVNSEILLLTTDYTAFSPKFFKEVFAKFLGVRNFEYAVTAMIIPIDINSSKLIIRGKARYTKGKGAVEKLVGGLLKQSRFDYLGEYNEQDQINVIIHKGTDMYKPIEFLANRIKFAAESEN
ncbi:MAG: hypothetical protein GY855_14940 [candidate division Zixibacteria bacterium]|nr:hypothetical protein [candidate division Zixibacteria bacterium]